MASSTRYDRTFLFGEMEKQFDGKNEQYFKELLEHQDNVVRTRAVCILADFAGENAVNPISKVLREDDDPLVRHEAAVALGVIGSEEARGILIDALRDESKEVRDSAVVALANLDYIKATNHNSRFTKMTGG
jgi:HEAT repeat protein